MWSKQKVFFLVLKKNYLYSRDVDTITEDVAADLFEIVFASFRTFGRSVPSVRISAKTLLTILKSGKNKEFFCTSTNAIINGFLWG